MSVLKMPARLPTDGAVSVQYLPQRIKLQITAVDHGDTQTIYLSEYNAWRLFGMLAVLLGLPLTKAVGKAIKL